MEASLRLQMTHLATWRSEGLVGLHRHPAYLVVQMSPRHLAGARAQAPPPPPPPPTRGCRGGRRRMATWRRRLSLMQDGGSHHPDLHDMLLMLSEILRTKEQIFPEMYKEVKELKDGTHKIDTTSIITHNENLSMERGHEHEYNAAISQALQLIREKEPQKAMDVYNDDLTHAPTSDPRPSLLLVLINVSLADENIEDAKNAWEEFKTKYDAQRPPDEED